MNSNDASESDEVRDEPSLDLFYTAAAGFSPNKSHLIPWLKNKAALRPIVDALTANLLRTWSMSILPQGVMHTAVTHDLLFCEATMEVLGRPFLQEGDTLDTLNQIAAKFLYLDTPDRPPRLGITEQMNHLIHYHKRKLIPTLHPGFAALLGAQIINVLTAFESLAQDLWTTAVNERPKLLGSKLTLTDKWRPSITMYQKFDFNLKRHMGDLIADKIRWDAFPEMQDAYARAFEDKQVEAVFKDVNLKAVNSIRNVLVHKAGIADKKFVSEMKGFSDFPTPTMNQPIQLNGKLVCKLTIAAIECASSLIRGVDGWLDSNPD